MADAELIQHIALSTGLTDREAGRVVSDVVAYYREATESFVRRRHSHHQTCGLRNAEIFERIETELAARVVAAPPLTERQLRRIVYS